MTNKNDRQDLINLPISKLCPVEKILALTAAMYSDLLKAPLELNVRLKLDS